LKRATASRSSGQWKDNDFDVLANGIVVGRIFKSTSSPVGSSWTLAFGHQHTHNRGSNLPQLACREHALPDVLTPPVPNDKPHWPDGPTVP
jgi:hypothetical protein